MAKKKKREKKQFESLIPEIKSEEQRLAGLLNDARADAERAQRDAETEAGARLRAAHAALPRLMAAERESRLQALRREADAAARVEEERTKGLEDAAAAAMNEAVAYVVSLVWPEKRK
jgi:hypothetical protein